MSNRKVVELFYDVVSPFTWFAFETLCRYRPHWNMDLKLKPFFLGAVMHATKNPPPPRSKITYSTLDLDRLVKYFDMPPIRRPKNIREMMFVKGTLKPQRFITAVDMQQPQFTEPLSRELWRRIFVEDIDATEAQSLTEAAVKAGLGQDLIEDALIRMTHQEVKDRLKAYTQEALDLGAFGAPFIVANVNDKKEVFFGSDRFPVLAMVLGETWKGPLPDAGSRL